MQTCVGDRRAIVDPQYILHVITQSRRSHPRIGRCLLSQATRIRLVLDISTPIQERPYMRRFRQKKPDGYLTVLEFSLHPQACQLAQHGGNRNRRFTESMPRSPSGQRRWLRSEIGAWEERRNQRQVKIHWSFTIAVARIKLHKLFVMTTVNRPVKGTCQSKIVNLLALSRGRGNKNRHRGITRMERTITLDRVVLGGASWRCCICSALLCL